MAQYEFTITIIGEGETVDSAWEDAVMQFGLAPVRPASGWERIDSEDGDGSYLIEPSAMRQ